MGYQITSSVDKLSVSPVVSASSLRLKSTASILVSSDGLINSSGTSKSRHVMENQVLQISPPQNPGIKRRKSQAKKVVCIPAPAPVNSSKQSGEIVPSDLWAWRKYGQKPIKGSPYPRGYYRCSSSKGCSARKQVERSRTDPNMLVITYTSEHNHPWPTQRNALAGSTRSSSHTPINNTSSSLQNHNDYNTTSTEDILKEDEGHKESNNITSGDHPNVKEEEIMEDTQKRVEMEIQVPPFLQIYRPTLLDKPSQAKVSVVPLNEVGYMMDHSEDFFADLGEIEAGPLNLLFENNQENKDTVALAPFGFYDWGVENNDSSNSSISRLLGGEVKGSVQQNP